MDHASQPPIASGDWVSLVQGLRFTNDGRYVCGFVDSSQTLVQVLDTYQSHTGTSYSRQNLTQTIKPIDENQLQTRFMSPAARPRLFWQMNAGEPTIQYDGVPFMSIGHGTDLPCVRFGGRRKRIDQVSLPSGDVVPVDYRMKTGCEAKITIRQILRYPCAQYSESVVQGIAAVRRQRKHILDDLVQRITSGSSKARERYHFLLPTPLAHNGHTVADIVSPPPVSQLVMDEIVNQLSNGITAISQLLERTKTFIFTTYGTESTLNPSDPMFCLSEFDMFCQVFWLYKTGRVVDHDSSFKNTVNLHVGCRVDQALSQGTSTQKSGNGSELIQVSSAIAAGPSSDTITNMYSIIMDDSPTHHASHTHQMERRDVRNNIPDHHHTHLDSPGPLGQIDVHQVATEREVELSSQGSPAAHTLSAVLDNSSIVNQIHIGVGSGMTGGLSQCESQPLQQRAHAHQPLLQHHQEQPSYVAKRSMTYEDPLSVKNSPSIVKSSANINNCSMSSSDDLDQVSLVPIFSVCARAHTHTTQFLKFFYYRNGKFVSTLSF